MPGRLARHRDTGEPRGSRPVGGPVQRLAEVPGLALKRAPGQDLRVVVGHHHHLLHISQIDRHDRIDQRHLLPKPCQPRVAVPVTTRDTD